MHPHLLGFNPPPLLTIRPCKTPYVGVSPVNTRVPAAENQGECRAYAELAYTNLLIHYIKMQKITTTTTTTTAKTTTSQGAVTGKVSTTLTAATSPAPALPSSSPPEKRRQLGPSRYAVGIWVHSISTKNNKPRRQNQRPDRRQNKRSQGPIPVGAASPDPTAPAMLPGPTESAPGPLRWHRKNYLHRIHAEPAQGTTGRLIDSIKHKEKRP
jgi:hypothetical protein